MIQQPIDRIEQHILHMGDALRCIDTTLIETMESMLFKLRMDDKRLYLAGCGGSHAIASHAVIDFQKCISPDFIHSGINASCLGDSITSLTAWSNDFHFEKSYAQMLRAMADPGDMVMVFSVSGCSPIIVNLVDEAAQMDLEVISMVGKSGLQSKLAGYSNVHLAVHSEDYGISEDCFSVVMHSLVEALKLRFLRNLRG